MKILFKTTDRKEANAQLRAFTKNANAKLDLRREAGKINFLTRIITAPLFALEYKGTIFGNDRPEAFNIAMLVVTDVYAAPVFMTRNFVYWFEHRERSDRKYSFCAVVYNDKCEYVLIDCNDMTSADANGFFNDIEKIRIR